MTHINLTLSEDTLHHLISGDDKGISMLLICSPLSRHLK